MPLLLLQCSRCATVFSSGIDIGPGATVTMSNNRSKCPRCGSWESLPEGTFRGTVDGIVRHLAESASPMDSARSLLELLKRAQSEQNPELLRDSVFATWMPNTPEKLTGYIAMLLAIVQLIIQLLGENPRNVNIEINQTFVNQYNSLIQSVPPHAK